jgi:hypothetical protein
MASTDPADTGVRPFRIAMPQADLDGSSAGTYYENMRAGSWG